MLPLLTITVFLSAALMFTLQPLVARLLLPVMGGSPAVWNTCMVFFQAVLLAGYAYAHAISGMKRPWVAGAVHLGVLVLGMAALPLALPAWSMEPPKGGGMGQAAWVLLVLAVVAGLPMFAVSATAPLAQKLLAASMHAARGKPYFLYAASNAGSLIALLAYPVLIEPGIGLQQQAWVWMAAYGMFVAMAIGSVTLAMQAGFAPAEVPRGVAPSPPCTTQQHAQPAAADGPARLWSQRAWWLVLSAAPSSLLLGVTNYLSTDVAAIPLLWVLPLAVYLLTFIIAFSERARAGVGPRVSTLMLPLIVLSVALTMRVGYTLGVALVQQVLLLFVGALACHVALARRAPEARRLTEFYLFVSLGGLLGGVFNSLIAPVLYNSTVEYPIAIVATYLFAVLSTEGFKGTWVQRPVRHVAVGMLIAGAMAGLAIAIRAAIEANFVADGRLVRVLSFALGLAVAFVFRGRPAWFVLVLTAMLAVAWNQPMKGDEGGGRRLYAERTFFGVHRVNEAPSGRFHTLTHGTTVHGLQFVTEELRGLPTMYYHPTGPIGHVFRAMESSGGPRRVAVVGLGAGALAAYARTGSPIQTMDFYEIDPEVVRIARDPKLFTYVTDVEQARAAAGQPLDMNLIIGDGRLELARAGETAEEQYDLIVLDAFSSDAIPVHLLTREAMAVYLSRLAPGGLIAIHISNRHIDLVPVLDALARAEHPPMAAVFATDPLPPDELRQEGKVSSQWAVLARDAVDLKILTETPGMSWGVPDRPLGARAWTDDWSDVVGQLRVFR